MALKIEINDKEFLAFVENLKKEAAEDLQRIMASTAFTIELAAKEGAPKDDGFLFKSIQSYRNEEKPFSYFIVANADGRAPYAPYIEFGTRNTTLSIPPEWADIAIKFKADPLIKATNIQAQPYMYPAFLKGRQFLVKTLKNAFLKKYKK